MNKDKLISIMSDDDMKLDGTSVIFGLNMMVKYVPTFDLRGVGHDIVYGENVDEMINAGMTEEDAILLRKQNWFIDDEFECFASFV